MRADSLPNELSIWTIVAGAGRMSVECTQANFDKKITNEVFTKMEFIKPSSNDPNAWNIIKHLKWSLFVHFLRGGSPLDPDKYTQNYCI